MGQSDHHRVFGGAHVVCVPAHTGYGWQYGGQNFLRSNLGVLCVWVIVAVKNATKKGSSPRPQSASSYCLYSVRSSARAVGRAIYYAKKCGPRKFAFMARCWQCHVLAAVGLCSNDVMEIDRIEPISAQSRKSSGLTLFFKADLFGLGALDRATCCEALVA